MSRYNHHVLEKKWLANWAQVPQLEQEFMACTVYIPQENPSLGLENLRLLMLTDFFGVCASGVKPHIQWIGAGEERLNQALSFGIQVAPFSPEGTPYDLGIFPRDFTYLTPSIVCTESIFCGRFLDSTSVAEFLPDFGLDALRLFFLFQGPPTRDYTLSWHSLAGAYRFIQKIWELGQNRLTGQNSGEGEALALLQFRVAQRLQQKKPHTALAAIMGFLREKDSLSVDELHVVANLLSPYTPFLSAELLSLITPI